MGQLDDPQYEAGFRKVRPIRATPCTENRTDLSPVYAFLTKRYHYRRTWTRRIVVASKSYNFNACRRVAPSGYRVYPERMRAPTRVQTVQYQVATSEICTIKHFDVFALYSSALVTILLVVRYSYFGNIFGLFELLIMCTCYTDHEK